MVLNILKFKEEVTTEIIEYTFTTLTTKRISQVIVKAKKQRRKQSTAIFSRNVFETVEKDILKRKLKIEISLILDETFQVSKNKSIPQQYLYLVLKFFFNYSIDKVKSHNDESFSKLGKPLLVIPMHYSAFDHILLSMHYYFLFGEIKFFTFANATIRKRPFLKYLLKCLNLIYVNQERQDYLYLLCLKNILTKLLEFKKSVFLYPSGNIINDGKTIMQFNSMLLNEIKKKYLKDNPELNIVPLVLNYNATPELGIIYNQYRFNKIDSSISMNKIRKSVLFKILTTRKWLRLHINFAPKLSLGNLHKTSIIELLNNSYYVNNIISSSNIVCYVIIKILNHKFNKIQPKIISKFPPELLHLNYNNVRNEIERIKIILSNMEKVIFTYSSDFTPAELIKEAAKEISILLDSPAFVVLSNHQIVINNYFIIQYYANRIKLEK